MTLYFRDTKTTAKFVTLCKRKKIRGSIKRDGAKEVVTVPEDQFRTKTERAKFVAAWATVSMETIDPGKDQRRMRYTSDEPEFEVLT